MTGPSPTALIEFRRCLNCRRTEIVETGEVIALGNQRHDHRGLEVENWVRSASRLASRRVGAGAARGAAGTHFGLRGAEQRPLLKRIHGPMARRRLG
jgi:hypothetical protein